MMVRLWSADTPARFLHEFRRHFVELIHQVVYTRRIVVKESEAGEEIHQAEAAEFAIVS